MLINAQRRGHLRVAIVEGTQLEDYQVEIAESGLTRGNIYRGIVANIHPSLNAAFVDIGEDRHAFLPVGDILPAAYHKKPPKDERRPRIDQVVERGKPILVQVAKDGINQKGAALITNLALAGRYLVLTPFEDVRGISRKAEDDQLRKKARERLGRLNLPDGCGVIIRTNGLDQNQTTLNRDLNALVRLWKKLQTESSRGRGPRLLYSDQDLVVQALFTPEAARWLGERPSYFTVERRDGDEGSLLTLAARSVDDLLPWLLGWGAEVTVLSPAVVRERLREEAEALAARYARDP